MLSVLLSEAEQSLKKIRFFLRESLPEVPASKLAEALADALGFRNNAALLAGLTSQDSSVVLVADPNAFSMRLASLGYVTSPELAAAALEKALQSDAILPHQSAYVSGLTGEPVPRELSEQLLTAMNKRGPTIYPSFDPAWSMPKVLIALVDMLGEDGCQTYSDFMVKAVQDPKEGRASFAIMKSRTHGFCQVVVPQLMEANQVSASKIMEFRRLAFDISGCRAEDYTLDSYIAAGVTSLAVGDQRISLPAGMKGLRMQIRPNGFVMRGIQRHKMSNLSEVFA